MIIGVTGTRYGGTRPQLASLRDTLDFFCEMGAGQNVLHHGDCVGIDEQAARLAGQVGYRIIGHPPTNAGLRAYFSSDQTLEPLDYLARDRAIVDTVEVLVGCPEGAESQRSGTWYTIRYARSVHRPVVIISPDGLVSWEGFRPATKRVRTITGRTWHVLGPVIDRTACGRQIYDGPVRRDSPDDPLCRPCAAWHLRVYRRAV